jgi:phage-related minor tail protein
VYGIVDSKRVPQGNLRNNLTIIAQTIQKLANGETFGSETEHMIKMNKFIEKNRDRLFEFMKQLPVNIDDKEVEEKYEVLKPITFEKINKKQFDLEDLKLFQKIIFEIGYELLENIIENEHEKKAIFDYISLGKI